MIWLLLLLAVVPLTVITPFFYQPFWLIRVISKIFKNTTFYIPTKQNYFAITFDDGPKPPYTNAILKILDRHRAKATFFVVGEQVEKYPQLIDLMRKNGHQVGNHFYNTIPSILLNTKQLEESLTKTEKLIKQKGVKLVRPSNMGAAFFGSSLTKLAKSKKYKVTLGSAYTMDWMNPPRWYMRWALTRMLRPGIIVVLHDGGSNRQHTVDILPHILREAKKRNLKAVTLNKLFLVK